MKTLIFDVGGVLVYPRLGEWHIPYRAAEILGPERAKDLDTERFHRAREACMEWLREDRLVTDLETERLLRRGFALDATRALDAHMSDAEIASMADSLSDAMDRRRVASGLDTERMLRRGFVLELDRAMGWRMTDDEIAAMTDDFTDNIDRYGFFDDVREWLERWSKEYTLAVLSDAMPSILNFLEQYGIRQYLSADVISTHVGATKPDGEMYRAALEQLNARPGDCLFVDDRRNNVEGAVRAGMKAVQMSRPEFPAKELWDGPVVHSFAELDAFIREGGL